jgi:hypothetical protein
VLVAGGVRSNNAGMVTNAELYDPTANAFTTIATPAPRAFHTATRLNSGAVLLAGGTRNQVDSLDSLATTEIFSPDSLSFAAAADMVVSRLAAHAVHLADDTVLIVGGFGPSAAAWESAEIFSQSADSGGVGVVNQPFTMSIPMSGTPPLTFTIRSGSLPAGLFLNSATGVISGTPTATGVTRLVVEFADSSSPAQHTFREVTITINPPIAIATTAVPHAREGVPYSARLVASGGAGPRSWSLIDSFLPPGLSLSADGVISGTPTIIVTTTVNVRVTDGVGGFAIAALTIVVE